MKRPADELGPVECRRAPTTFQEEAMYSSRRVGMGLQHAQARAPRLRCGHAADLFLDARSAGDFHRGRRDFVGASAESTAPRHLLGCSVLSSPNGCAAAHGRRSVAGLHSGVMLQVSGNPSGRHANSSGRWARRVVTPLGLLLATGYSWDFPLTSSFRSDVLIMPSSDATSTRIGIIARPHVYKSVRAEARSHPAIFGAVRPQHVD